MLLLCGLCFNGNMEWQALLHILYLPVHHGDQIHVLGGSYSCQLSHQSTSPNHFTRVTLASTYSRVMVTTISPGTGNTLIPMKHQILKTPCPAEARSNWPR